MNILKILFVVIIGINFLIAQEKYPSRNSKEWNELTVAQRWQAVNILDDQLKKMSTNELIEHCVNFDFMADIFFAPSYGDGLKYIINNHNALRELINRKDAGRLLLSYYRKIDFHNIKNINKLVEKGEFVAKIFYLELFLTHENILNQFYGNEKDIVKAILASFDICLKINSETQSDIFDGYAIGAKALAIGKALYHINRPSKSVLAIEEMNLDYLSNEEFKKIIENARNIN